MSRDRDESCDLAVRVTPRSSKNCLSVSGEGSIKVWVSAAPADGQANEAVIVLLAKALGIAKSRVEIVRGETGRDKLARILWLTEEEALRRLKAAS